MTYWDGTPYMTLAEIEAEMEKKYGPGRGVGPWKMPIEPQEAKTHE